MSGLNFVPAPLAQLPWKIILLVLVIGCFDLLVMYSAAGGSLHPWALSQGIRFFIFLAAAVLLSGVRESTWSMIAIPAYTVLIGMLILVELIGAVRGGGQRWLDLGIIRLQPSELMKVFIVLAVARFYDALPTLRLFYPIRMFRSFRQQNTRLKPTTSNAQFGLFRPLK